MLCDYYFNQKIGPFAIKILGKYRRKEQMLLQISQHLMGYSKATTSPFYLLLTIYACEQDFKCERYNTCNH